MYVPPYSVVEEALGLDNRLQELSSGTRISLEADTLRFLLQYVALAADFDEKFYLEENPDVAQAHEAKEIIDPHLHFIQSGYFEGRSAARIAVDEEWYLNMYPDVQDGVKEGAVASAREHFTLRGNAELRSPSGLSQPWIKGWAEAFNRLRRSKSKIKAVSG